MRLSELISGRSMMPALFGKSDPEIVGITADSREVRPGWLFAALPGSRLDGRAFIRQAIDNGASAILTTPDARAEVDEQVGLIADGEPRQWLAKMAATFYRTQPDTVVAVTGTNGKTSVAEFTRQIWAQADYRSASLGTLGLTVNGKVEGPSLTTPDPVSLHALMKDLATREISHAAIEASSHGLDQSRLDGLHLKAAAFTNLSRDHLDYHGTMEAYLTAKMGLFDRVMAPGGTAVLNGDADEFQALAGVAGRRKHRIISFGQMRGAELRIATRTPAPSGQVVDIIALGRARTLNLPLVGAFQAWNAMAALGLAIGGGMRVGRALECLAKIKGVRGRMEKVATLVNGAAVYVDYAHTPDALQTVLTSIRPHVQGNLWCVFGCGGDRDAGKRPLMGAVVDRLADKAVITDDNPRSEDPASIREAAAAACPDALNIGDRAKAIQVAMEQLGAGDVLVIAGKGHEPGQEINGEILPFDDASVARGFDLQAGGATS